MIRALTIENFRSLRRFRMTGLGRVNLLVGTNNCGKSSILEAIHVLARPGDPRAFLQAMVRRGEFADDDATFVEVGHIIHGHKFTQGTSFEVRGTNDTTQSQARGEFVLRPPDDPPPAPTRSRLRKDGYEVLELSPLDFQLTWSERTFPTAIRTPVTLGGGIHRRWSTLDVDDSAGTVVQFISTDGLTRDEVVALFEKVVLTEDEPVVLTALQTIEPNIERLASVGSRPTRVMRRGGIDMRIGGQRLPIGTMGDGIWRLLGVALALVRSRGGVLLVDEIDTGLHYSVLAKMWRLVLETSARLDIQVFATTHSRDCVESLAQVSRDGGHDISLQRVEREREQAVAFTESELMRAAERGIEVR
jgi:energy-coupling factor transporter ATP-binding protein EcfA2